MLKKYTIAVISALGALVAANYVAKFIYWFSHNS